MNVWRFASCLGVLGKGKWGFGIFDTDVVLADADVAVGSSKGRDGTVWKYPGDGCCFPLFVVDDGAKVEVDCFVSSFNFELDPSPSTSIVDFGVNRLSPSPSVTPFLAALALALSSLFALALSPPLANISLAA